MARHMLATLFIVLTISTVTAAAEPPIKRWMVPSFDLTIVTSGFKVIDVTPIISCALAPSNQMLQKELQRYREPGFVQDVRYNSIHMHFYGDSINFQNGHTPVKCEYSMIVKGVVGNLRIEKRINLHPEDVDNLGERYLSNLITKSYDLIPRKNPIYLELNSSESSISEVEWFFPKEKQ